MARSNSTALGITIGLGNHKGGVGKSTNAVHLAAALGEMGHRCLLIDLDPTAGTTKLVGIDPEEYEGTLELLTSHNDTPLDCVLGKNFFEDDSLEEPLTESEEEEGISLPEGVHLIPARTGLSDLDEMLRSKKYVDRFSLLKTPLKTLKKYYDFIIVDTPPQPGSTLLATAYASLDWFLLSVHAEPLALSGLMATLEDIAEVRRDLNKRLEILGVIIGRVKRSSSYWQEIDSFINETLPGRGFDTQISDTVQLQKLSQEGVTLFQNKRLAKNKVTNEYRAIAAQIQKRTLSREKFLAKSQQKLRSVVNG